MCGRFAQKLPSHMLLDMYKIIPFEHNVPPNYNVAPTDPAMVVRANLDKKRREAELMKWGLVLDWLKSGKMDVATINAKCETAATAATYRNAFKSRRCIIPADAYYEWKKVDAKTKQPYAIGRADRQPLLARRPVRRMEGQGGQVAAHLHHPDDDAQQRDGRDPEERN